MRHRPRDAAPRSSRVLAALTIAALVASLTPRATHATTVVPVTVETLATRADAVVIATPRWSRSQWLGRTIVTDYELEVSVSVRGTVSAGTTIVLRLAGGSVGRIGQMIPGVIAPAVGTPYLFFLSRAAGIANTYYTTHLTAAVLPLSTATTPTVLVRPATEGMVLQDRGETVMSSQGVTLARLVEVLRAVR